MADEEVKKIIEKLKPVKCEKKKEIDFIKEIRKELVDAHLEYDKKLSAIWEKLNKYIKENSVNKK